MNVFTVWILVLAWGGASNNHAADVMFADRAGCDAVRLAMFGGQAGHADKHSSCVQAQVYLRPTVK